MSDKITILAENIMDTGASNLSGRDRLAVARDFAVNLKAETLSLHETFYQVMHTETVGMLQQQNRQMREQVERVRQVSLK